MPDSIHVVGVELNVVRDGETNHVILTIGSKDYDVTERVYEDLAVQAAIKSLESMSTRAI